MKIASLIIAIILILLIGLVVLFEVTPDADPVEGNETGLLIIFFVIPFFAFIAAVLLVVMSKGDKHK